MPTAQEHSSPLSPPPSPAVYVLATLDTKGTEARFLVDCLSAEGVPTELVDVGCLGEPQTPATVTRQHVFQAAGQSLAELQGRGDRGAAVAAAASGAARVLHNAHRSGRVAGVLGLGGSAGTTIASAAMRELPLTIPKVLVSTLASGDVAPFVGSKNIAMIYSVVDIAGLNRISRTVLAQAAAMLVGAVRLGRKEFPGAVSTVDRPLIAATMFGVTTPCVQHARSLLEAAGFEVLVFHATGSGGRTLESLIDEGLLAGVLDITTTELADELVGGVMSAGPTRLTSATRTHTPQVVSVGATDMVNFWALSDVPAQFQQRQLVQHNPQVTLMRTTAEECKQIGRRIGDRVAAAPRTTHILLPERGVSALDREGQPFYDPQARQALFDAIRTHAGQVPVEVVPCHINDVPFAELAARRLLEKIQSYAQAR